MQISVGGGDVGDEQVGAVDRVALPANDEPGTRHRVERGAGEHRCLVERFRYEVTQEQVVDSVRIGEGRLALGCRRPRVDRVIAGGEEGQRTRRVQSGANPLMSTSSAAA